LRTPRTSEVPSARDLRQSRLTSVSKFVRRSLGRDSYSLAAVISRSHLERSSRGSITAEHRKYTAKTAKEPYWPQSKRTPSARTFRKTTAAFLSDKSIGRTAENRGSNRTNGKVASCRLRAGWSQRLRHPPRGKGGCRDLWWSRVPEILRRPCRRHWILIFIAIASWRDLEPRANDRNGLVTDQRAVSIWELQEGAEQRQFRNGPITVYGRLAWLTDWFRRKANPLTECGNGIMHTMNIRR